MAGTIVGLSGPPLVIAHRALPRHAPENSLEGIRTALRLRCDLAEIDVRATRDGVPVVIHDLLPWQTVRRPWPVRWCRAASVARWRLANGEPLPTLADALAAAGQDMGLVIEVKEVAAVTAVLACIEAAAVGSARLWSPLPRAVRACAQAAPSIEVSLLQGDRRLGDVRNFLAEAVGLGARGVCLSHDLVIPDVAREATGLGLALYCGFPDLVTQRAALEEDLGLTGFTTDWPEEALAQLGRS